MKFLILAALLMGCPSEVTEDVTTPTPAVEEVIVDETPAEEVVAPVVAETEVVETSTEVVATPAQQLVILTVFEQNIVLDGTKENAPGKPITLWDRQVSTRRVD